MEANYN